MKKRDSLIPISYCSLTGNEERYVLDAIRSAWISSIGRYVTQFEESFASYIGVQHAVSVSNGTCALHLALKALGIGSGDEVIVPSFTFAATINAILHAGALPVLVDCLPHHWSMDPGQMEKAISPATKAVIPVHLYGHPCDMESILSIAEEHKIFIIEDAAEAQGAESLGRKAGGLGHIGCFSFYGNKIITTGEGGMCVTNDPDLNERLRKLRDHGMSREKRYWHEEIGFNFRLTNLNAAVGVAQLERIEEILKRRADLAVIYEREIRDVRGLRIYAESPFGKKVEWLFCVFIDDGFPFDRDTLLLKLREYNIDARPTFYPVHTMPPYKHVSRIGDLSNALRFGLSGINLPLYPSLKEEDVHYIVAALKEISGL